jgi:hypothetical protein
MRLVEIKDMKELENSVVKLLLQEYNNSYPVSLYLEPVVRSGCFNTGYYYKFYRETDIPNHYEEGHELSESDTMQYLSQKLNELAYDSH